MNIKLISSNSFYTTAKAVIKKIGESTKDFDVRHIVVVPDRFSLCVEKMVFEELDISSTFNIDVCGMGKLLKLITKNHVSQKSLINDSQALVLVKEAINKTKNDFVFFNKNYITIDQCKEILDTLKMFSSNDICPDQIKKHATKDKSVLSKKLYDFYLIFNCYQQLLSNSFIDDAKLINIACEILCKDPNVLGNAKIYFAGFDSFTAQGYELIDKLSQNYDLCVGVMSPQGGQLNSFLYEQTVKEKIASIALAHNASCENEDHTSNNDFISQTILTNIFSHQKPKKFLSNNALSISAVSSTKSECENVAKNICAKLSGNVEPNEINVAVAGLKDYVDDLAEVFKEYNIPYFFDINTDVKASFAYKLLMNILNLARYNFLQSDILDTFSLEVFDDLKDKNDIINFIEKYDIKNNKIDLLINYLQKNEENYIKIINFFKKIKDFNKFNNYLDFYNNISNILLEINFDDIFDKKIKNLEDNNNVIESVKQQSSKDKLFETLESLLQIEKSNELTFRDFYDLTNFASSQIVISLAPISSQAVYVGDINDSFFETKPYLYVLNANSNSYFTFGKDTSLLSDKDIDSLAGNVKLEPTIAVVNFRKRIKNICSLCNFSKELKIYFKTQSPAGDKLLPANIVDELQNIFEDVKVSALSQDLLTILDAICEDAPSDAINYFSNKDDILKAQLKLKNLNDKTYLDIFSKYASQKELNKNSNEEIYKIDKMFFDNNRTKISEIETYFDCPFKNFAVYHLKLKEKERFAIDPRVVGNIIHECLEKFCQKHLGNIKTETADNLIGDASDIFDATIMSNVYSDLCSKNENKIIVEIIKQETLKAVSNIIFEQRASSYNIKECEFSFGYNEPYKYEFDIDGKKISLVGKIDRIDNYGDFFRIIDYKTGNVKIDAGSIFYGEKVQAYAYANAIKKSGKLVGGLFYMQIDNSYEKNGEKQNEILRGFYDGSVENLVALDSHLCSDNKKSKIIHATLLEGKKELTLSKRSSSALTCQQLNATLCYVDALVKNATAEILSANITPSPRKIHGISSCDICKFQGVCKFSQNLDGKFRARQKVTLENIINIGQGGSN